ncbi:MAG TPA: methyltransferase, partial [Phenylobacterium sp.]|nr:methyltransferase [Phenylobacterium sp.]
MIRRFLIAAAALVALGVPFAALGQPKAPGDALTDPALKGPEVIAFMGLKPGNRVADIIAGRFVRAESQAVGPKGKVYAVMPAEVIKAHPEVGGALTRTAADPAYGNVVVSTPPID